MNIFMMLAKMQASGGGGGPEPGEPRFLGFLAETTEPNSECDTQLVNRVGWSVGDAADGTYTVTVARSLNGGASSDLETGIVPSVGVYLDTFPVGTQIGGGVSATYTYTGTLIRVSDSEVMDTRTANVTDVFRSCEPT